MIMIMMLINNIMQKRKKKRSWIPDNFVDCKTPKNFDTLFHSPANIHYQYLHSDLSNSIAMQTNLSSSKVFWENPRDNNGWYIQTIPRSADLLHL